MVAWSLNWEVYIDAILPLFTGVVVFLTSVKGGPATATNSRAVLFIVPVGKKLCYNFYNQRKGKRR